MPKQPKTRAEHLRDGTFRSDRHGGRMDANFSTGVPENTVEDLGKLGQTVRSLVISSFPADALTALDGVMLDAACLVYEQWRDLARDETASSVDKSRAFNQWTSILAKFGATPADRCKLKVAGEVENEEDALEALMRQRNN